jgi:hypothetical protein
VLPCYKKKTVNEILGQTHFPLPLLTKKERHHGDLSDFNKAVQQGLGENAIKESAIKFGLVGKDEDLLSSIVGKQEMFLKKDNIVIVLSGKIFSHEHNEKIIALEKLLGANVKNRSVTLAYTKSDIGPVQLFDKQGNVFSPSPKTAVCFSSPGRGTLSLTDCEIFNLEQSPRQSATETTIHAPNAGRETKQSRNDFEKKVEESVDIEKLKKAIKNAVSKSSQNNGLSVAECKIIDAQAIFLGRTLSVDEMKKFTSEMEYASEKSKPLELNYERKLSDSKERATCVDVLPMVEDLCKKQLRCAVKVMDRFAERTSESPEHQNVFRAFSSAMRATKKEPLFLSYKSKMDLAAEVLAVPGKDSFAQFTETIATQFHRLDGKKILPDSTLRTMEGLQEQRANATKLRDTRLEEIKTVLHGKEVAGICEKVETSSEKISKAIEDRIKALDPNEAAALFNSETKISSLAQIRTVCKGLQQQTIEMYSQRAMGTAREAVIDASVSKSTPVKSAIGSMLDKFTATRQATREITGIVSDLGIQNNKNKGQER